MINTQPQTQIQTKHASSGKCSNCPYRLAVLTGQEEFDKWFEMQKKTECKKGSSRVKDIEESVPSSSSREEEWEIVESAEERDIEEETDQELQVPLSPTTEDEDEDDLEQSTLVRLISSHTLSCLHHLSQTLSPSLFSSVIKRRFTTTSIPNETPEEKSARFDKEIGILLELLEDPDAYCCEDGEWFMWREKDVEVLNEAEYESEDDGRLSLSTPIGKEAVIAEELSRLFETFKGFEEDRRDEGKFGEFERAVARVLELMREEERGGEEEVERSEGVECGGEDCVDEEPVDEEGVDEEGVDEDVDLERETLIDMGF